MIVAVIVEGHGERDAVPLLIRRVGAELLGASRIEVPPPLRWPRSRLIRPGELERAVELSASKVGPSGAVLILLDSDDDCPAKLGPRLLARARRCRPDRRIEVVLAHREFEAWFIAGLESLAGHRTLPSGARYSGDPESVRDAKGWLDVRMEDGYRATLDQAAFAAKLDLAAARLRAPSFDKLIRAVSSLLAGESGKGRAGERGHRR